MIQPSVEARSYFNEQLAKHCGGDKARAETKPPHAAFVKVVLEIRTREEAERFFGGMLHWLHGRKPRTFMQALDAARANVVWCFDEPEMTKEMVDIWTSLWSDPESSVTVPTKTPEESFKAAAAVGEKIKAGKDPGMVAALAKKALQKRAAAK